MKLNEKWGKLSNQMILDVESRSIRDVKLPSSLFHLSFIRLLVLKA